MEVAVEPDGKHGNQGQHHQKDSEAQDPEYQVRPVHDQVPLVVTSLLLPVTTARR